MIRQLIVAYLIFLPFLMFGQSEKKSLPPLVVGINYSANYSNRILKSTGDDAIALMEFRSMNETPSYGQNMGIFLEYQAYNKIFLETGFQFVIHAYELKDIELVDLFGETIGLTTAKFKHNYMSMPMMAKFQLTNKKTEFRAIIGFSLDLYLGAKESSELQYNDGRTESISRTDTTFDPNKKEVLFSGIIGFEIARKLTDKIHCSLKPLYRPNFYPLKIEIGRNGLINQFNYSLGIQIALGLALN